MSIQKITLNGEPHELSELGSISQLLEQLSLIPGKVAVERNLEIVPRSLFDETKLKQGDRIEIVRFIGGG